MLVQVVQHLAHPPVELAALAGRERSQPLVFITRNIPEQQVRDLVRSALRALVRELSGGRPTPPDANRGTG